MNELMLYELCDDVLNVIIRFLNTLDKINVIYNILFVNKKIHKKIKRSEVYLKILSVKLLRATKNDRFWFRDKMQLYMGLKIVSTPKFSIENNFKNVIYKLYVMYEDLIQPNDQYIYKIIENIFSNKIKIHMTYLNKNNKFNVDNIDNINNSLQYFIKNNNLMIPITKYIKYMESISCFCHSNYKQITQFDNNFFVIPSNMYYIKINKLYEDIWSADKKRKKVIIQNIENELRKYAIDCNITNNIYITEINNDKTNNSNIKKQQCGKNMKYLIDDGDHDIPVIHDIIKKLKNIIKNNEHYIFDLICSSFNLELYKLASEYNWIAFGVHLKIYNDSTYYDYLNNAITSEIIIDCIKWIKVTYDANDISFIKLFKILQDSKLSDKSILNIWEIIFDHHSDQIVTQQKIKEAIINSAKNRRTKLIIWILNKINVNDIYDIENIILEIFMNCPNFKIIKIITKNLNNLNISKFMAYAIYDYDRNNYNDNVKIIKYLYNIFGLNLNIFYDDLNNIYLNKEDICINNKIIEKCKIILNNQEIDKLKKIHYTITHQD